MVQFGGYSNVVLLQWGRALVRAEGDGGGRLSWSATWLQWGRALVRAEGRQRKSRMKFEARRLQWGRALVRAEGRRAPTPTRSRRCFNGAARWCARKGRRCPRRGGAGRACFNGAARWCARKVRAIWWMPSRTSTLQWGRALVRAEGRGSCHSADHPAELASMGPRAGARGRSPSGSVGGILNRRSFNGAARWCARKGTSASAVMRFSASFNGAARWCARKGPARPPVPAVGCRASMGPRAGARGRPAHRS